MSSKNPEKKKGGNKHMRSTRTKRKYGPYTSINRRERNKVKRIRRHLAKTFRRNGVKVHRADTCAKSALQRAGEVFPPGQRKILMTKSLH